MVMRYLYNQSHERLFLQPFIRITSLLSLLGELFILAKVKIMQYNHQIHMTWETDDPVQLTIL